MTTQPQFDRELFARELSDRMDDLAGDPAPAPATVLTGIRRRAASQRRRRQVTAVAAAALVVAGIGTAQVVLDPTADRAVTVPAVTGPTPSPVDDARTGKLLGWPMDNNIMSGPRFGGRVPYTREQVLTALLTRTQAAWDDAAGPGHEDVRLLFAVSPVDVIVVAEGRSGTGQARLAVLTGDFNPGVDTPDSFPLVVQTDVPIPTPAPDTMVITTRSPTNPDVTWAVELLPTEAERAKAPAVRFRATNPGTTGHRTFSEHQSAVGQGWLSLSAGYRLADFQRGAITIRGRAGRPDRRLALMPRDSVTRAVVSADGQWAAVWVP